MAPKYSKKKAKYTYAERELSLNLDVIPSTLLNHSIRSGVLSALSSIQKDHRKHAVHMATLRAHGTSLVVS